MNIGPLESMARQALRGESIEDHCANLVEEGSITRAEQRSLQMLTSRVEGRTDTQMQSANVGTNPGPLLTWL